MWLGTERVIYSTASEEDQQAVDGWPVVLDEVRQVGNGDHGLFRIQVTALHRRPIPPDVAAKLAAVLRDEDW